MASTNPLDLPEIRLQTAVYLTPSDAAKCVSVCKSWHHTFLPIVWASVEVKAGASGQTLGGPSPDALERHRDLVIHLDIDQQVHRRYTMQFPKLRSLSLRSADGFNGGFEYGYNPAAIIASNPSLTDIAVFRMKGDLRLSFWNAIEKLDSGVFLAMFFESITDVPTANAFWKACTHLHGLDLDGVALTRNGDLRSLTFPNIRKLKLDTLLGLELEDQLELIIRCPAIEELYWSSDDSEMGEYRKRLSELAASGAWPKLESVDISGNMDDGHIAALINSMEKAAELTFSASGFGPQAYEVLQSHFRSLQVLCVVACPDMTSPMLLQVLSSCPALTELQADEILAGDIIGGNPWICCSLRIFGVNVVFQECEQDLQPFIFERFASLKQLRVLSVGYGSRLRRPKHCNGIQFRLQSGLNALSKLKHLRCLKFQGTRQILSEEDVIWMINHWRTLALIVGPMHQEHDLNQLLQDLLKNRGIEHHI